ncbi:gas vesicle protein GvpD P-loop domain-containing protein [Methanolobus profundi]|uniref:RecA-superfamily ATPase, KaiC/GvpD/RAD55 family n=1 Tax=Methanolobus profundi TaxID=487685 RepID=A0A1I4UI72_9EURY|nr:gas vesicle protein GvpD P-loop domain-containing protein [Methanolobus profundi]SFM88581.1 RecA-superfamily ATPase, KaiC/GvpD/RAD55 family [Methanolobus profundi]
MIPGEVKEFFSSQFGKSLLVKGKPGTGKTTFVFGILDEICSEGNCVYISPRIDKSSGYGKYPWIEGDFNNNEDFLRMLATRIKEIWESSETKPTIVVDSIDSLSIATTRSADWEENKFELERLLFDFSRKVNADLIMITEQTEVNSLDYLVDGVVFLDIVDISDRDIRKIDLLKIRGVELSQSRYPFTLDGGVFTSFEPFKVSYPQQTQIPQPLPDPIESKISTGMPDFDKILDGGYQKGSFNLFEITSGVGDSFYSLLLPTFINHLNMGRGLLSMPTEGTSVETEKRMISSFTGDDRFHGQFMGFEIRDVNGRIPGYIEPFSGNVYKDMDIFHKSKNEMLRQYGSPLLDYIGLDSMEYNYGWENIGSIIGQMASITKTTENVVLAVTKHGQRITESVAHMATTHWKFENVDKTLVMYGVVPRTGVFAVHMEFVSGYPQVSLIPMK